MVGREGPMPIQSGQRRAQALTKGFDITMRVRFYSEIYGESKDFKCGG